MLMRQASGFRMHVRLLLRRIFYLLLDRLGIRRLREHSFFAPLLARPAAVMDLGAHRGEFFAALESEHPVFRALLIEADLLDPATSPAIGLVVESNCSFFQSLSFR